MPSLRDIAEEAGVSQSTASRVLNGKHRHKISDATRSRVLEIARRHNYAPNPQAVSLATGCPPNTLGLAMPYHSHTFRSFYFSEISCGALDVAHANGMDVNLLVYRDIDAGPNAGFLQGRRMAGLILLGTHVDEPLIAGIREAGVPFVAANYLTDDPDVMTVHCDNERGAYEATRHMVRLGHRRIAFLAGPEPLQDARERRRGYMRALCEAGLDTGEPLVAPADFNEQGGRQAMREILEMDPLPTAIVAANDQSALGAMAVARRAGLRIPSDIAFIGFDDIPSAQHSEPALSTIHQPIYRLGQRAAQMLISRIGGASMEPHQALRTRLVVRDSCGARRTAAIAPEGS